MDNETKNILKILGVAVVILYLTRPKSKGKTQKTERRSSATSGSSSGSLLKGSVAPPKTELSKEDQQFKNAVISLKAVRKAVNNNEPNAEIDKLNRILIKDYGIKVFKCKGSEKLVARDSKGRDIAKEE